MRPVMLAIGIGLIVVGGVAALVPLILADDPEAHFDEISEEREQVEKDGDDPDEHFEGRGWWVRGEVVLSNAASDLRDRHEGEDLWFVYVGAKGSDFEDCFPENVTNACFPATSRSEVSEGDSGIFFIRYLNKSSDCKWGSNGTYFPEQYCITSPTFWLTMKAGVVAGIFYGGGSGIVLIGVILLFQELRGRVPTDLERSVLDDVE